MTFWDDQKLRDIRKKRQIWNYSRPIGKSIDTFMRYSVIARRKKLGILATAWNELLPDELLRHSCLEDLSRGQLKVLVDSSVHFAELNMMIREGLLDELRQMCPSLPISKIKLKCGRWYHVDEEGNQIADF